MRHYNSGLGTKQLYGMSPYVSYVVHRPMSRKQPTREELLSDLERLRDDLGRRPIGDDLQEADCHSTYYYKKEFGSWSNALAEIGEDARQRHPDEELLDALRNLADELGRSPSAHELSEQTKHSHRTYQARFGSWNGALEESGLEVNKQWGTNTTAECSNCGETVETFPCLLEEQDHFFCDDSCMGEWESENYRGDGNPRYSGGYDGYYGPTWPKQRQRTLERDGKQCVRCGLSNEESKQTDGRELSVHHRIPIRQFGTFEEAHKLGNLVTLCNRCHQMWEAIPIQPETPGLRASD